MGMCLVCVRGLTVCIRVESTRFVPFKTNVLIALNVLILCANTKSPKVHQNLCAAMNYV